MRDILRSQLDVRINLAAATRFQRRARTVSRPVRTPS